MEILFSNIVFLGLIVTAASGVVWAVGQFRHRETRARVVCITAAVVTVFGLVGFGITHEPGEKPQDLPPAASAEEDSSEPAQSDAQQPADTTPPATTPEPEDTLQIATGKQEPSAIPEKAISADLEIITREGHPTYYGSVEVTHKIWDGTDKGKVVFADSYENYSEGKTILLMDSYRNSDLIRDIEIYFSNFEEPVDLGLDEVLKIAASYMPFEIMRAYYQYKDSELLIPNEKEDGAKYYIISYSLTEEGKAAYGSKEHEYSGSIDVIIEVDAEDTVQNICIGFGTPRWMSSLSLNGYHSEEWVCDLFDWE